jgi:hypothetical protein
MALRKNILYTRFYVRAASGSVGMKNTIQVNTGASNWIEDKKQQDYLII